jgi:geranylgeranyl diphosphate synthase type I
MAAPATPRPGPPGAPAVEAWLQAVREQIEPALAALLDLPDEERVDARWSRALAAAREYVLRPAKRLRPALVLAGWELASGGAPPPDGVWRMSAALELLHAFLLVHDDVADAADTRRGGPALHLVLGSGRRGRDLAVVVGDHLFSRAVEAMLASGLAKAPEVVRYYLGVCRLTAAGQFLDLELSGAPLRDVTLFQTLKIALLKTARYSFAAPLVVGARLGGAGNDLTGALERLGRQVGLAFQLRDDLLGLFGSPALTGKPAADWLEGKPTFPVVAAYTRAPTAARREIETLWRAGIDDLRIRARLRELIDTHGGRAATEHAMARTARAARRTVDGLPVCETARGRLDALVVSITTRHG